MARPTKYKPEYCKAIVDHMRGGASATSFAASIGVCRATINVWADEHPEFLEALKRAKAACAEWWENLARQGASGNKEINPTLVIFGLKNMAPDDFVERKAVEHSGPKGGAITVRNASDLTDDELAAIASASGD
jgi:transposase